MARVSLGVAGVALTSVLMAGAHTAWADGEEKFPNFSSANYGWLTVDDELKPMTSGPRPVRNHPDYPYYGNQSGTQPTFRISDAGNPILTDWAREILSITVAFSF